MKKKQTNNKQIIQLNKNILEPEEPWFHSQAVQKSHKFYMKKHTLKYRCNS